MTPVYDLTRFRFVAERVPPNERKQAFRELIIIHNASAVVEEVHAAELEAKRIEAEAKRLVRAAIKAAAKAAR